ncbi:hypothetical protein BGZ60DRAFT_396214 [Tricladium varicosporioides]|nr:hypothetical protein BGZ60DRAFT_396214 [Hymenoscyphus varicosporioides]
MPSETKGIEHEPFLQYTDDPTTEDAKHDRQYLGMEDRRDRIVSHGVVFIITSLLWLIVLIATNSPSIDSTDERWSDGVGHRQNITSNAKLLTCGASRTPQEARAMGCKYDVLMNAFVPAPCYDEEFIEEYKDDASWAAFSDANMTQRLTTIEEIQDSGTYYTSFRDHVNHCAVMWKKQFWVLYEERRAVDTMSASPGHTDHCAQYLIDASESDGSEPTKVDVGYEGCWIKD